MLSIGDARGDRPVRSEIEGCRSAPLRSGVLGRLRASCYRAQGSPQSAHRPLSAGRCGSRECQGEFWALALHGVLPGPRGGRNPQVKHAPAGFRHGATATSRFGFTRAEAQHGWHPAPAGS
jgi:hypothetical protein